MLQPKKSIFTRRLLGAAIFVAIATLVATPVLAQEGTAIPPEYKGEAGSIARGILDGNLIETNFRNHGEVSRWNDIPFGVWPRSIGGRHIDGIGVVVAGRVRGERAKWSQPPYDFWAPGTPDTVINPVSVKYRDAGTYVSPYGDIWGWLPLPGFHNETRRNLTTLLREPTPALSDDPTSWPAFWPDKLQEEDSGWPGYWNGMGGKSVFSADLESFYVMDDYNDGNYLLDPVTGRNFSQYGIFYPDNTDSTKGGMSLQMNVRILQWANILAEDTMFLIYRITNTGTQNYGEYVPTRTGEEKTGLYFAQFVDYGLGEIEADESAAFNPQLDIAYGWDHDGYGEKPDGSLYKLGVTGFAFLESPARAADGLDNDEDGITDEQRFGGPGMRIEGRDAIRSFVESNYNMLLFERHYGALEDRPAYRKGVWWTGDENLDWIGYDDSNENGQFDQGELVNDDYGRDGLGPFDPAYTMPDEGEGDGIPTIREPNFDELDVDESDQIGLTGFHLSSRPYYENGNNLREDTWMWLRIRDSQFELGAQPEQLVADVEPFLNFSSGPVDLANQKTDFFSTAWLFGEDFDDFFRNRETVQRIYNADYRFAQPPIAPIVSAQAGDGYVILSWDTLSVVSYDRFTQEFDFEGYKLYKGTDNLLRDAKLVTDVYGIAQYHKPIARWDLDNGIAGTVSVLENTAQYDLGSDTGLEFSYIDRNVINGKTYYYALVAYDHGFMPPDSAQFAEPVDPQENTFNVSVDQGGNVQGFTPNVAIVTPRSRTAGYVAPGVTAPLDHVTEGLGTGSADIIVVDETAIIPDRVYKISFFDTTKGLADIYQTTAFELTNVTDNQVLIKKSPIVDQTPAADGFVIQIHNDLPGVDDSATGWEGSDEDGNTIHSRVPSLLTGYDTNWFVTVAPDESARHIDSAYEYTVHFADSMYTTPSARYTGYLRSVEIPMWCTNVTLDQPCDLFVRDDNENGQVDMLDDTFVIGDKVLVVWRFRYTVNFTAFGASNPPDDGNLIRVTTLRPFSRDDFFQFTLQAGTVDQEMAKEEMKEIAVVPNPYIAAADWEPRTQISGRGPRMVQFIHLPPYCKIRIYTIRGELVRELIHDEPGSDGTEWWDLQTESGQDVAYGVYLFHVEAREDISQGSPVFGEKVGKFALIK